MVAVGWKAVSNRQHSLYALLRWRADDRRSCSRARLWLCVLIVRLAEGLLHFLATGGAIADFPEYLIERFSWSRFLSIQIWLMVLFLIYVTVHELNTLFGDGELYRLFFRWRSSEAKLTRRRRIRLLTRLNRLTEVHPIQAFSERGSPVHAELVSILDELASPLVVSAART